MITFTKTSDYVCTHSNLSKIDNRFFVDKLSKALGKMRNPVHVHQVLTDFAFFIGTDESDLDRINAVSKYISEKLARHAVLTELLTDYLKYLESKAALIREYND